MTVRMCRIHVLQCKQVMASVNSIFVSFPRLLSNSVVRCSAFSNSACHLSGELGSGAGKGGGSGGAVREAGGTFGKLEAAREEEYFKKLQSKQLMKMKCRLKEEIANHEKMIAQHKEAIARHMQHIQEIKQEMPAKPDDEKQALDGGKK